MDLILFTAENECFMFDILFCCMYTLYNYITELFHIKIIRLINICSPDDREEGGEGSWCLYNSSLRTRSSDPPSHPTSH